MEDVSYILCFTRKRASSNFRCLSRSIIWDHILIGYLKVSDRLLLAHFYLSPREMLIIYVV